LGQLYCWDVQERSDDTLLCEGLGRHPAVLSQVSILTAPEADLYVPF
jgi:hypothetical protein